MLPPTPYDIQCNAVNGKEYNAVRGGWSEVRGGERRGLW